MADVLGVTQVSNEEVIFAGIFKRDEGVYRRKQDLITTFSNVNVFKNEYYIFYTLTKDFPKIIPDVNFIRLFLQTNKATFQKSKSIEMVNYKVSDSDPYAEFVTSCLGLFEECFKKNVSDEEFYRSIEMHKMTYLNMKSIEILEESAVILSEGITVRGRHLNGYEDMKQNLKSKLLHLDNLQSKSDRRGLIFYGVNSDEEEEEEKLQRVTTYGIEDLDKYIGGIYEGDMVSLLAPAKGCKSRFCTYVVHNAIVNNGTNCVAWSVENGYKNWESLIRARHFSWYYNSKITDVTQKRFINNDMIRKGELSPELAEQELASWTDLKCNSRYGKFVSIDEDFEVDTFIEVIDNAVNAVGAKLIFVDYLQLIGGGDGKKSKSERIAEAYVKLLSYIKRKKIAAIIPAQLKQNVVGDLQKVDPEELVNTEMRNSAGESYEVIKTPDVNLALYGTPEDIRNGNMTLLGIPSRNSAPFEPISLYVDAGSCTFASLTSAS